MNGIFQLGSIIDYNLCSPHTLSYDEEDILEEFVEDLGLKYFKLKTPFGYMQVTTWTCFLTLKIFRQTIFPFLRRTTGAKAAASHSPVPIGHAEAPTAIFTGRGEK